MKLYLTLDNEKGNKIERVIKINETSNQFFTELNNIGNEMFESICEIELSEAAPMEIDIAPDELKPEVDIPDGIEAEEPF